MSKCDLTHKKTHNNIDIILKGKNSHVMLIFCYGFFSICQQRVEVKNGTLMYIASNIAITYDIERAERTWRVCMCLYALVVTSVICVKYV